MDELRIKTTKEMENKELRAKAQDYIDASDKNATVGALADANTRIDELMEAIESLKAQLPDPEEE